MFGVQHRRWVAEAGGFHTAHLLGKPVKKGDFGQFGIVDTPTPSLLPVPGAQVDLNVPIPLGCFNPDCDFRITVDVHNVVNESIEGNNTATGMCIG